MLNKLNSIQCIDALMGLKALPDATINLIITSPPYADIKKSYGHVSPDKYVDWFLPIAEQMFRVLTSDGSLILNINDKYEGGVRLPYSFELMLKLREIGFNLIDIVIWAKSKGAPISSARRGTNYWEPIFHFCKSSKPIWNVDEIRTPYPQSSIRRAKSLIKVNVSNKEKRTSDNQDKYKQWNLHPRGSWPKNLINFPQAVGNNLHPASFHVALPKYFIKAHTSPGDVILDPFAGIGTTCLAVIEENKVIGIPRKYLGFEIEQKFVDFARNNYGL